MKNFGFALVILVCLFAVSAAPACDSVFLGSSCGSSVVVSPFVTTSVFVPTNAIFASPFVVSPFFGSSVAVVGGRSAIAVGGASVAVGRRGVAVAAGGSSVAVARGGLFGRRTAVAVSNGGGKAVAKVGRR